MCLQLPAAHSGCRILQETGNRINTWCRPVQSVPGVTGSPGLPAYLTAASFFHRLEEYGTSGPETRTAEVLFLQDAGNPRQAFLPVRQRRSRETEAEGASRDHRRAETEPCPVLQPVEVDRGAEPRPLLLGNLQDGGRGAGPPEGRRGVRRAEDGPRGPLAQGGAGGAEGTVDREVNRRTRQAGNGPCRPGSRGQAGHQGADGEHRHRLDERPRRAVQPRARVPGPGRGSTTTTSSPSSTPGCRSGTSRTPRASPPSTRPPSRRTSRISWKSSRTSIPRRTGTGSSPS